MESVKIKGKDYFLDLSMLTIYKIEKRTSLKFQQILEKISSLGEDLDIGFLGEFLMPIFEVGAKKAGQDLDLTIEDILGEMDISGQLLTEILEKVLPKAKKDEGEQANEVQKKI